MTRENTFTGGCLCRAVRFEVEAPTKWCAHCHCSLCRRAHGAAFVTWFGVTDEQFHFVAGEDQVRWYASTPEARRGFCTTCGSTMFFRSARWAGETHVALACMDRAIDRMPAGHVFFDAHVDWVDIDERLDRFGGETGTDPLS